VARFPKIAGFPAPGAIRQGKVPAGRPWQGAHPVHGSADTSYRRIGALSGNTSCVGIETAIILGRSIASKMGRHGLAEIRIFDGESIESALRRFKRQVQQEGIIKEVKKHAYYLKPGEKKRLKSALAQKLKRKKVRRQPVETDPKAKLRKEY